MKHSRRLRQRTGTKARPERKPERGGKQVRAGKAVQAPVHHLPVTAGQTAAIRTKNRDGSNQDKKPSGGLPAKRKLSYKEQRELEQIEKDLEALGREKSELESALNSGALPYEELQKASERIGQIISLTDEKELRWLELSV